MVYLRARDYSPSTGRFTSRDTVSPNAPGTQGYNAYAYVAGNPVTLTDPTGHAAFEAQVLVSLSLSSAVMGAFAFQYSAVLVGVGPVMLATGATIGWVFLILAVIFFALALYIEVQTQCAAHGMSLGECIGLGGSARGDGIWDVGWSRVGIAGAGAAAASCVLGIVDAALLAAYIFSTCPSPPKKPDERDDCDELEDDSDGWFDPTGTLLDDYIFGDDEDAEISGAAAGPVRSRGGSDGHEFRGGEAKADHDAIAKQAAREAGLNERGAEELHRRITGQQFEPGKVREEIRRIAKEVAEDNPNQYRTDKAWKRDKNRRCR